LDHGAFDAQTLTDNRPSREMKVPNGVSVLLAVCLLAFAGCKKSGQGVAPNTEYSGVKVDWTKLDTEFAASDQELQAKAGMAKRHIRYSQFADALGDLEGLSADPKLTEPQKKVVADLVEQTKQVIAKAPPPGQ
jgi:hypothetical protein